MSTAARKTHNGVHEHAAKARVRHPAGRMIRKRSKTFFFGLPLWEVARGPNPAKGERVGHARAIVAVGDIADGVLAIGGISRGVISIGGISFGLCSVGGVSVGLAAALGGVAAAPLAVGGVAIGLMALGGAGCDLHGRLHAQSLSESLPHFVRHLRLPWTHA